MADYTLWRVDSFDNTLPPPHGWPEHAPPRTLNDNGREVQSAMARRRDRLSAYPLSTGTENSYRVEIPFTPDTIPPGFRVGFTAHQSSVDGEASFQVNFTPEMPLRVASGTGVLAYEIVEGESYDLAFEGSTYRALHARSTGPDGTLRLGFIPDQLNGVDVGSIDGLSFSSEATGDDSNTLYFRTSNGGEIYHGATRVESLSLGSGPITTVQHGAGYVFALPQEVVDGTFTSLSNTSVRISWTAPLVGSQPLTYTIERDDNSDFTSPTTLVEDTAAVTHDDTGLTEATQYYYRVRASNYIGDGPYSAGTTVTGGVTPGVPTSVSASAVSTSAIDVTWGAPTTGTTPFTYTLQRATNSAFSAGLTTLVNRLSSVSYDDTGLASSTTYYYRVRAHNIVGDGSYVSTNATTDTPVVAPGAVTSYTASALSSSSIRLTWSAPSTGTSPFTYRGERATNSSFTAGTATLFSSSSSTTYTNTGLSSGTTYYFRVRAINSAGSGPYTTRSAVTTGSAPTVPTGLTATALDDDRVRLSWTASSGPTPITYDIQQNNTTIVNNRTSTTYTRSGLSPNTSYNFRVRAGNSNGHSAWTSNVSATTHTIALGASIAFTGSSVATTALGGGFFTYTWTGTFRADGSAGTTPYTYDWSGSTGGVISGSSTSRNVTIVVTSDVAVTPPANDAIVARVAIGDAASGSASAAFTQTVSFA